MNELKLTICGACVGGEKAVEIFMDVKKMLEQGDGKAIAQRLHHEPELLDMYEQALNRLRYEVAKSVPRPVKHEHRRYGGISRHFCGKCRFGVAPEYSFCPNCGTELDWKK